MNINRDYLIINDVKKSNVKLDNGSIFFYITDKNTQNIFVNLVINVSKNDLIQKYANIENAEDYTLTMNIVKPGNTYKIIEGKLHDKENAIFEFDLNEDCCDEIGTYRCELLTKCNINGHEEITTSNKLTYKVKASVLNDLDDIVEAPEYPLVIQLFDKLSDIEQYEEDRRANELARQLAEEQRQARFDTLINDTKANIDEYKVAKDQEIDEYKTAKDTEINNAITNQDNKIDTAISEQNDRISNAIATQDNKIDTAINAQNDRIAVVENNVVAQNDKLDTLENKVTTHEARITATEAKDAEQDGRLDIAENRLANIGNDITNTMQPIIDEHTSRLDTIEAIDVSQNNRLDAIEAKNQQQDDRLLDIEKVNKKQDMDIKCLFNFHTVDITEEGNSVYLQNSAEGYCKIDNIQGNTLVNCNKEPNKELILNGNINTSTDNNVTLTEGVDGGLVDVALEGNTLVNVSKTKDITALPLEEELTYLYASTQYTVQFVSDTAITVDLILGGTELLVQDIVVGLNRISITTPDTLANNKLIIDGVGAKISEVVVTDTDREFMYFEGMKSVGECEDNVIEVLSNNKNLADFTYEKGNGCKSIELIDGGFIATFDGTMHNNVRVNLSDNIIKLNSKFNLVLSYDIEVLEPTDFDIASASDYIGYATGCAGYPLVSNNHTAYLAKNITRFNLHNSTNNDNITKMKFYNMQITLNNSSSYIPHQSNSQTLNHEPLRAVGEVKDRYVLIDGMWYIERQCREIVLDGSEDWSLNAHSGISYIEVDDMSREKDYIGIILCDKLKTSAYHATNIIQNYSITGYSDVEKYPGQNWIYLSLDDSSNIKTWLQSNPSTVVYKLASPVYEPIDYNPLEVYSGTTHITTNSTIPTNITVKNHGFNCLLKPSTTYTISSNLGLNTVTTPSVLTEDCLRFMDTDTSNVTTMKNVLILEGDWTSKADLIPSNFSGIESAFEQEYDEGKGKYKVNVKVANEDKTKENNITFYINEPLRGTATAKDKVFIKDDKLVVQRNCGIRPYEDGDFGTYLTDKVNTVYQLPEPTYEEVEYNDVKLFIESFKGSTLSYNSNVPVTSKLYYSYSVPIVDTVAQTANVTDQQDSMIIDLATQVAVMEMMLM